MTLASAHRLALGVDLPSVKVPRGLQTPPAKPDREQSLSWLAVRLSLAGDRRTLDRLFYALLHQAARLGKRESWRPQARGVDGAPRHYLADLCALVLDAELHPALFAADPALYAATLGVTQTIWRADLEPRYRALRACLDRWRVEGLDQVRAAITGAVEDSGADAAASSPHPPGASDVGVDAAAGSRPTRCSR